MLKKNNVVNGYIFIWKGKSQQGKILRGEISGNNITLIKLELRRQGIIPIKVRKKSTFSFNQRKKKITSVDISIFFRQLSTMLVAGIPLVQALEVVRKSITNLSMQKILNKLRLDLEAGHSFCESLNKQPKYFGGLTYSILRAGEHAGTIDTMLACLVTYKEKMESLKAKIKKTLIYPVIVILVAIIISAILLIFVVPQFEKIFNNSATSLPLLTCLVMNISSWLQNYWWLTIGIFVALAYSVQIALKESEAFALAIDKLLLKLPIIGKVLHKSIVARFSRTLATTIAAGLPLMEALHIIAKSSGNRVYDLAIEAIRKNIATGQQLYNSMNQVNLFPPMVIQMIAVGEESGALEKMLSKIADFYEEQLDNDVDSLSSLIEPMIILILGVVVGTIVVAMYLPIFNLGTALKG